MPRKPKASADRYEDLLAASDDQGRRIDAIKRYIQREGKGRDPAPEVEAADELYEREG